jgi:hypothetical protein
MDRRSECRKVDALPAAPDILNDPHLLSLFSHK